MIPDYEIHYEDDTLVVSFASEEYVGIFDDLSEKEIDDIMDRIHAYMDQLNEDCDIHREG